MIDCGHVFCTECLQNFYNSAIKEGDLAAVRCLEPSCAKERAAAQASDSQKRSKRKTFISPSELLQIPLEPDMVKRYVTLKYKTELESDKHTVYCPRPWCQGAARSKKRKKPEGFELHEAEDESDSETEDTPNAETEKTAKPKPYVDRLAVCEDCGFAFCSRCYQGWHGDFVVCAPRRDDAELSAEEKASLDFISLHTTPCPTCACPAQKTHGCNHMYVYLSPHHGLLFLTVSQDLLQVPDTLLLPVLGMVGPFESIPALQPAAQWKDWQLLHETVGAGGGRRGRAELLRWRSWRAAGSHERGGDRARGGNRWGRRR